MPEAPWPAARYRLLAKAYIPRSPGREHEVLEEGAEVVWDGKPGPHMQPLDEEGEAAMLRAGPQKLDPFGTIQLNAASEEELMGERIGAAVAKALAAGGAGGDAEARIAALEAKIAALAAPPAPLPPPGVLPPPSKK